MKKNKKIVINEIKALKNQIKKWSKMYYTFDNSKVSDAQYDGAMNELIKLENAHPELITPDSPTQTVGNIVLDKFIKVEHDFKMLSLNNAYNEQDIFKFDNQIIKITKMEKPEYTSELKIDGVSISLKYKKGKFFKAITRGNGSIGEDVTHNVRTIKNIPLEIPYKMNLEVRGEIFLPIDEFKRLNKTDLTFSNPRNAAAGTLRQLNSSIASKRKLNYFIYSLMNPLEHGFNSHFSSLEWLKTLGFNINSETKLIKNYSGIMSYIEKQTLNRDKHNYQIDGIVIKVNNFKLHQLIGVTSKFPKWAIAYKFPEKTATTTLLKIFPSIGRTGKVTYNAKLAPTQLAGSVISAATLHNATYVKKINVNTNDIVEIKKAGDIIPKVIKVHQKINNKIWIPIKNCPSCNSELVIFEGEVDQYCISENCPEKLIAKLVHYISREAMDIQHFGSKNVRLLVKQKFLSSIKSIYQLHLHRSKLIKLDGFNHKSIDKILKNIANSKNNSFDKLLFGLGIRHVGNRISKLIVKNFPNKEALFKMNFEKLINIREIGSKVASSLTSFFELSTTIDLFNFFEKENFNLTYINQETSNKFENKKFVITGSLSQPRQHFKTIIEKNGGLLTNSLSKNTDYLIIGENYGSKFVKAKELKITIISEEKFNELM